MKWPQVKTILIALLLLVNALLLSLFLTRQMSSSGILRQAERDVISILANQSVEIAEDVIPPLDLRLPILNNERDSRAELDAVSALLGDVTLQTKGGNIISYTSGKGYAEFRGGGYFEFGLVETADDLNPPTTETVKDTLDNMGFNSNLPEVRSSNTPSGTFFSVIQSINGYNIFNCRAELDYTSANLTNMSGRWILGNTRQSADGVSISPASVLLGMVAELESKNTNIHKIFSMQPGYFAELGAPGVTRLTPVWLIGCDTGEYMVSAETAKLIEP